MLPCHGTLFCSVRGQFILLLRQLWCQHPVAHAQGATPAAAAAASLAVHPNIMQMLEGLQAAGGIFPAAAAAPPQAAPPPAGPDMYLLQQVLNAPAAAAQQQPQPMEVAAQQAPVHIVLIQRPVTDKLVTGLSVPTQ